MVRPALSVGKGPLGSVVEREAGTRSMPRGTCWLRRGQAWRTLGLVTEAGSLMGVAACSPSESQHRCAAGRRQDQEPPARKAPVCQQQVPLPLDFGCGKGMKSYVLCPEPSVNYF